MCWSELDPDNSVWTIPKERSKNGRAHTLPLPQLAWDIIEGVPTRADADHLFGVPCRCTNIIFRKGEPAFALLDFDTKGMPPSVAAELKRLGGFLDAMKSSAAGLGWRGHGDAPIDQRRGCSAPTPA